MYTVDKSPDTAAVKAAANIVELIEKDSVQAGFELLLRMTLERGQIEDTVQYVAEQLGNIDINKKVSWEFLVQSFEYILDC